MSEVFISTKRALIDVVAERWYKQYHAQYGWRITDFGSSEEIYEKLLALPPYPSEEQVVTIIGNDSWTTERCDCCGESVDAVAVVGDSNSYSRTRICADCLKDAMQKLEEAVAQTT